MSITSQINQDNTKQLKIVNKIKEYAGNPAEKKITSMWLRIRAYFWDVKDIIRCYRDLQTDAQNLETTKIENFLKAHLISRSNKFLIGEKKTIQFVFEIFKEKQNVDKITELNIKKITGLIDGGISLTAYRAWTYGDGKYNLGKEVKLIEATLIKGKSPFSKALHKRFK